MKTVLAVLGTRPEAIKMAPVIDVFRDCSDDFSVKVCITAQHRELLDPILDVFGIVPDIDLDIMKQGQDLFDITAQVVAKMKTVLDRLTPNLVLVQGDTTTTFAAALAAFYQRIDVGHIEAGLRTYNLYSPYPEEANRQMTTRIARHHFAPTQSNMENLLRENVDADRILVTGNTVIDALYMVLKKIRNDAPLEAAIACTLREKGYGDPATGSRRFILVTGHRRENFGQGFLNICQAIKSIAEAHPGIDIVYPVHLNPNVREPVSRILRGISNIYLIEPLDYTTFVYLMDHAYFVLTDSGGVQEEAPSLGKPALVMRDTTERPEAVNAGTVKIVGTDPDLICHQAETLLTDNGEYDKMSKAHNPYGDGKAALRIAAYIKQQYGTSVD